MDIVRGQVLEERSLGPADPTGWLGSTGDIGNIHLTPDGKSMVFQQWAFTGHLHVVRGLAGAVR